MNMELYMSKVLISYEHGALHEQDRLREQGMLDTPASSYHPVQAPSSGSHESMQISIMHDIPITCVHIALIDAASRTLTL